MQVPESRDHPSPPNRTQGTEQNSIRNWFWFWSVDENTEQQALNFQTESHLAV